MSTRPITVLQARSILGSQRLQFGNEHQIRCVKLLEMVAELEELPECPYCDEGEIVCEVCSGDGICPRCEGECGECKGDGYYDCPICESFWAGRPHALDSNHHWKVSPNATDLQVADAYCQAKQEGLFENVEQAI